MRILAALLILISVTQVSAQEAQTGQSELSSIQGTSAWTKSKDSFTRSRKDMKAQIDMIMGETEGLERTSTKDKELDSSNSSAAD